MPFDTVSTWRQRLRFNDALLAQVEEHARDLEDQHNAAQAELTAALARLDATKVELNDVRAQRAGLEASGDKLRRSLSSRVLKTFPDELLRAIFLHVLLQPQQPSESFIRHHCAERAQAPFVLAAVCSRWSSLALRIPHLWTYISVPSTRGVVRHSYRELVPLLVNRSQSVSLDIVLPWTRNKTTSWEDADTTSEAYILEILASESHRWRSFYLAAAEPALTLRSMSLLRMPTPGLEECTITCYVKDQIQSWAPAHPNFLPLCPNLHRFVSHGTNILPSIAGGPTQLLSICELDLLVDLPCADVWDILRHASPRLEILNLEFKHAQLDNSHVLTSKIDFPFLRSLTADATTSVMLLANASLLSLKALRTVTIEPSCLTVLRPVWQYPTVEIKQLVLDNSMWPISSDDATALLPLPGVEDLTLTSCTVTGEFLAVLAEEQPDGRWVLPNLRDVTIQIDSEVTEEDGEHLVRFARARQLAHERGGEHAPCQLHNIVVYLASVPEWAMAQARYFLSASE